MCEPTFDNWEHFTYINRTISYVMYPNLNFNQSFIESYEIDKDEPEYIYNEELDFDVNYEYEDSFNSDEEFSENEVDYDSDNYEVNSDNEWELA